MGVRAVIAKSFSRIHKANLINSGIAPLQFHDPADYDRIDTFDTLVMEGLKSALADGRDIPCFDETRSLRILLFCDISPRERSILIAGGMVRFTIGDIHRSRHTW